MLIYLDYYKRIQNHFYKQNKIEKEKIKHFIDYY